MAIGTTRINDNERKQVVTPRNTKERRDGRPQIKRACPCHTKGRRIHNHSVNVSHEVRGPEGGWGWRWVEKEQLVSFTTGRFAEFFLRVKRFKACQAWRSWHWSGSVLTFFDGVPGSGIVRDDFLLRNPRASIAREREGLCWRE